MNPKSWSAFLKNVGYILNNQLLQQWISVSSLVNHDLLSFSHIFQFFLFQNSNSLFKWNHEFRANKTNLSASRYDKSINLFCSLANILRKVFYWECLEFWKFEENCPIIWGSKISIESLFFVVCFSWTDCWSNGLFFHKMNARGCIFLTALITLLNFVDYCIAQNSEHIIVSPRVSILTWCCLIFNIQHPRTTTHNMSKGQTVRFSTKSTTQILCWAP